MPLSIIIPTLNEAAALPTLLGQLRSQRGVSCEILVADGGSSDATAALARTAGVIVVPADRGRGRQMNAGAQQAQGRFLLFLHADSQLPSTDLLTKAVDAFEAAIAANGHDRIAGHFPLRFIERDKNSESFYRHLEGKTRLNRPYTINGDQGLLISARFFHALGGFDERLPFLEDQYLAGKIFDQGQWRLLPGELHTSARRFETEGRRERYTLMAILMGLHAARVEEFFARAPAVYAAQSETGRLRLQPMLRLIRQIFHERGVWASLKILYRIGQFVRENAWQLADGLATLLVSAWFFIWLPLQLRRSDSIQGTGIA